MHPVARKQDATEVLSVIISKELCIPWPGGLCQLATHEPGSRLHVEVFAHLPE